MNYNFPATKFNLSLVKQFEQVVSEFDEVCVETVGTELWWDEFADLAQSIETLTRNHEEEMKAAMLRVVDKNVKRNYYPGDVMQKMCELGVDVSGFDVPMTSTEVLLRQQEFTNRVNSRKIVPGYEPLANVLDDALNQAQQGKGSERHGQGLPFKDQPIMNIPKLQNSDVGLMYQSIKKLQESQRMDKDAVVRERLGAINYIAASILFLEGDDELGK